ncbi:NAD-dependent epimerase/dehydratase family protein [Acidothermaceae bacterium B102]|nr:NAD-dependent epimerase/dehydratase family protein [Acidothermaceae bacterium B102]
MKVLVTGGAGFIGSHVVEQLLDSGCQVRILDLLLPLAHGEGAMPPAYLDPRAEFVLGDVRDPATVDRSLVGVDVVCHQAAMVGLGVDTQDLPDYASHNILGTAVLLAAMARAGVSRLVQASSMVVYGEGRYRCPTHGSVPAPPRSIDALESGRFEPRCPSCGADLELDRVVEDDAVDPRNTYAVTKVSQEQLAAAWVISSGATAISLRYHNVYGPRMPRNTPYAGVASIMRSALERGESPRVYEDGGQLRDFVHVSDVARANLLSVDKLSTSSGAVAYNVASGEPHTVGEMAFALAKAFGGPEPVVTGQFRLGDVRHIVASAEAARRDLGFTAMVGFDDGMADFATAQLR